MPKAPAKWDLETDVLVAGSGGAALTAALSAAGHGAATVLIEKTGAFGGTTAMSGGGAWIPMTHRHREKGIHDNKEDVFRYCKRLTGGRASDELIHAYIDKGPEAVTFIEDKTGLVFEVAEGMPDYHVELPGGAYSRTLMPELFCKRDLGDNAENLRIGLGFVPMRFTEVLEWNAFSEPQNIPFDLIAKRMAEGLVGLGEALTGYLYKGCLELKVDMHLNIPFKDLIVDDDGMVIGARAEKDGKDFYIKARKGVILGTGGYEWNDELKVEFLPGPITHPNTLNSCEGEALIACMAIGAKLGNMSEVFGWMSAQIPGEVYEGKPLNRGLMTERTMPHQIMVNKKGKRFVNEACNYNNQIKPLWEIDPNTMDFRNLPYFYIFDQQFKDLYCFTSLMPGDPAPPWVPKGDTIRDLAKAAGIDPDGLEETVAKFNEYAKNGADPDFGRGAYTFDQSFGDRRNKPNPSLGPIEKPPFYAIPLHTGTLGTCGGPKTTVNAEVLHAEGHVIEGVYAVGNTMASVTGPSYWGGGATIGPGLVFGYIAGRHAASRK